MEPNLSGKAILIVEGSLLAGEELADACCRSGARVQLTANIINAFGLLKRIPFDGAVIDRALHNEAYDLCSELRELSIPYICCSAIGCTNLRSGNAMPIMPCGLGSMISAPAYAPIAARPPLPSES